MALKNYYDLLEIALQLDQTAARCADVSRADTVVALDGASEHGVVVSKVVVCKTGFGIEILSRQPQWQIEVSESPRILVGDIGTERFILVPAPDCLSVLICSKARCVEMIGVTI